MSTSKTEYLFCHFLDIFLHKMLYLVILTFLVETPNMKILQNIPKLFGLIFKNQYSLFRNSVPYIMFFSDNFMCIKYSIWYNIISILISIFDLPYKYLK